MKKIICLIWLIIAGPALAAGPYDQASALYAKGQYAKALALFQKALRSNMPKWQVYEAIGNCYVRLKDNDNALKNYYESLKRHSDNPALEYYVSNHALGEKDSAAIPPQTDHLARGFDLSFTWGLVMPFQSSVLGLTINGRPWQASWYLGIHPTSDWAMGIQVDYIDFFPTALDSSDALTYNPGSVPASILSIAPSLNAGNISLNFKAYPFSDTAPISVYLLGGGGLFVVDREPFGIQKYDSVTSGYDYAVFPGAVMAAPSLDQGLSIGIKMDADVRGIIEGRMTEVFLAPMIDYATVSAGVLYLF